MPRAKSDYIVDPADDDQDDAPQLTEHERGMLAMALSNPVGLEARRRMESEDMEGEIVTLRGPRNERAGAHRIDSAKGTIYFWEGKAKATAEQKEELLKTRTIS